MIQGQPHPLGVVVGAHCKVKGRAIPLHNLELGVAVGVDGLGGDVQPCAEVAGCVAHALDDARCFRRRGPVGVLVLVLEACCYGACSVLASLHGLVLGVSGVVLGFLPLIGGLQARWWMGALMTIPRSPGSCVWMP